MLIAAGISTFFYSASYPYIYAETLKAVPQSYISLEQILSCLGIIVFCRLWNKKSDTLFRYYDKMLYLEIIADGILFVDVICREDLKFYFILNLMIYAIITRNICCGGTKMRAMVNPTDKERECYDNNLNIICSIATLAGASIALLIDIPIRILFILALIGNTADNLFYLYIYRKIKMIAT